jgi:signal transduction histidine kinase
MPTDGERASFDLRAQTLPSRRNRPHNQRSMSSAPPVTEELGNLATVLCDAEMWLALSLASPGECGNRGDSDRSTGFLARVIREKLTNFWSGVANAPDAASLAIPELQAAPWNIRLITALPLRDRSGAVAGALCLLNPKDSPPGPQNIRVLISIAERLARAVFLPDGGFDFSHLPRAATAQASLSPTLVRDDRQGGTTDSEHYARMERFEGALLGLVKAGHDDLQKTSRLITEVAAAALAAQRVEIWLFDEAATCLRRRQAFPPLDDGRELALCAADCPRFFAGLDAQLVMAISDAAEDPRGQELAAQLRILDVSAMLIAPVWLQGKAAGVLAHFHSGGPREWTRDEQDFANAVAGILALALEADAHRNTEAQLHALAAHLDAVREEERAALAREVHDQLGQMLTALRMDVAWIGNACTANPEKLLARGPERVNAMKQLLDEAVATVQRISSDLRPGPLHELGLIAALEWQLAEFQKRSGVLTTLAIPEGEVTIDGRIAIALYRALQEALTNVARHAEATEARVTLRVSPQRISLEIRDNGKGIPEHATRDATSLGLIGLRERAGALGGEVLFRGAPGGTAVLVSLPNPAGISPEANP